MTMTRKQKYEYLEIGVVFLIIIILFPIVFISNFENCTLEFICFGILILDLKLTGRWF
jgi:hypothetical protein